MAAVYVLQKAWGCNDCGGGEYIVNVFPDVQPAMDAAQDEHRLQMQAVWQRRHEVKFRSYINEDEEVNRVLAWVQDGDNWKCINTVDENPYTITKWEVK